jgi:propanediol dehydratase small subunit
MSATAEYPFYERAHERLRLPDGRPVSALSLESLTEGAIEAADLGIHPETLAAQAEVAEEAGFKQLAENLRRAAELAAVPDERILEIYDALRPGRADRDRLEEIARELEEQYRAPRTAAFVREGAAMVEVRPRPPLASDPAAAEAE